MCLLSKHLFIEWYYYRSAKNSYIIQVLKIFLNKKNSQKKQLPIPGGAGAVAPRLNLRPSIAGCRGQLPPELSSIG